MKRKVKKAWQVLWNRNEKYHSRIKKFINWVDHAFNSIEITNHVNIELNKNYKLYFIRNLMKSELNLTLKIVKPRPNNVNFYFLKTRRQLFAVKFSQFISGDTLVINIDESSINRNILKKFIFM